MGMRVEVATPTGEEAREHLLAGWYGLGVLVLASIAGSIVGRGLFGLVAESIKGSLHLSDGQLGALSGFALTLVTAVAAIPVGWLADKVDRRWLLAVCVLIWSAATAGMGLSQQFSALFLCAMGVAVGDAVLGPVTYSVIPDLFPRRLWVLANSVAAATILLGFYLGTALSGRLLGLAAESPQALPALMRGSEPWRTALIASAWSGPPLALLILLMRLKRKPGAAGVARTDGALPYMRRNARALIGVFFGFGLSYAAFGAQGAWGAVVLQRLFHVAPAEIGMVLGLYGAVAALAGVAAGAGAVQLVRPRYGEHAPMLVAQAALLLGLIVALALPFAQSALQFYVISLVKLGLTFMATSLSPTVLQQLAPAHLRGRVIAIGGMVTVLAQSIMPWLVGGLSDSVFHGPRGILWAMAAVILPGLMAGLLFLRWGAVALPETIRRAAAES